MKFNFHLDSVEDAQLVQIQMILEEIASEIPPYVLIEKDFQMTKLNVFHVIHIQEHKIMDLTVLLINASPTK